MQATPPRGPAEGLSGGHLSTDRLHRLTAGGASLPLLARLLAHLRRVCPECRHALDSLARGVGAEPTETPPPAPGPLRLALCAWLRRQLGATLGGGRSGSGGADGREARAAVAALLEAAPEQRRWRLQGDPALGTPAACEELVRRSRAAFITGETEAAEVAVLALAAALRLDPRRCGPALAADCRAVAAAAVAGARAQAGATGAAATALECAEDHLEAGSGDPYAAAEVHLEAAAVAVAAGRLRDALALLARASRLYRHVEDRRAEALARVLQARLWEECGELEKAAAILSGALARLDRRHAPALAAVADRAVARLLPRLVSAFEEETG